MASTVANLAVAFAGDAAPSRPYVNVPFSGHADAIPMAPGSIEAELLSKYGGGQSSSAPLASSSSPSSPYVDPLSRVMPTIFVAGPAKSGSTFLWDCLQASFHPETQCGGARRAAGWGDGACAQPFVLPSLVGEILVGVILGPHVVDFVPFPSALKSIGEVGLCLHALEAGLMVDVSVEINQGVSLSALRRRLSVVEPSTPST